jgi:hypothetical protein
VTVALQGLDREKLVRVLGMLGSAHDGEIAAAGRAADALVRAAGSTWYEVVCPAPVLPMPPPDHRRQREGALAFAFMHFHQLDEAERKFVTSIKDWRGSLSQKQAAWLDRIVQKLHRSTPRAA